MSKIKTLTFMVLIVFLPVMMASNASAVSYNIEKAPDDLNLQFYDTFADEWYYYNRYQAIGDMCSNNSSAIRDWWRAFSSSSGSDPCFAIQNYDMGYRWGYSITPYNENSTYKNNEILFYWTDRPLSNLEVIPSSDFDEQGIRISSPNINYAFISFSDRNTLPEYCTNSDQYCWKNDFGQNMKVRFDYGSNQSINNIYIAGSYLGRPIYPLMSNFNIVYPQGYTGFIIPKTVDDKDVGSSQAIIDTLTNPDTSEIISDFPDYNQVVGWLPPGPIDSMVNLPLTVLTNFTGLVEGAECPRVDFTFPPPMDYQITVPCFKQTIWPQYGFMLWLDVIGYIIGGLMLYAGYKGLYERISMMLFRGRHISRMAVGEL